MIWAGDIPIVRNDGGRKIYLDVQGFNAIRLEERPYLPIRSVKPRGATEWYPCPPQGGADFVLSPIDGNQVGMGEQ